MMKGKPRVETCNFPVLLPSTWFSYMLAIGGELILGGHNVNAEPDWRSMLSQFWKKFLKSSPYVDLKGIPPEVAVPIAIHGDEGRGRVKRPIMILAWQPIISWLGPLVTNASGSFGLMWYDFSLDVYTYRETLVHLSRYDPKAQLFDTIALHLHPQPDVRH